MAFGVKSLLKVHIGLHVSVPLHVPHVMASASRGNLLYRWLVPGLLPSLCVEVFSRLLHLQSHLLFLLLSQATCGVWLVAISTKLLHFFDFFQTVSVNTHVRAEVLFLIIEFLVVHWTAPAVSFFITVMLASVVSLPA